MSTSIVSRIVSSSRAGRTHFQKARSALRAAGAELGPVTTAMLLIAPVVAAALFYVWTRVATLRIGYELSRAGETHRALLEQNRGLRVEAAALKAPERLARLAQEKYGLAPPLPSQIVRLPAPAVRTPTKTPAAERGAAEP